MRIDDLKVRIMVNGKHAPAWRLHVLGWIARQLRLPVHVERDDPPVTRHDEPFTVRLEPVETRMMRVDSAIIAGGAVRRYWLAFIEREFRGRIDLERHAMLDGLFTILNSMSAVGLDPEVERLRAALTVSRDALHRIASTGDAASSVAADALRNGTDLMTGAAA